VPRGARTIDIRIISTIKRTHITCVYGNLAGISSCIRSIFTVLANPITCYNLNVHVCGAYTVPHSTFCLYCL